MRAALPGRLIGALAVAGCGEAAPTCDERGPVLYQDPESDVLLGLDEAWIGLHDAIARGVTEDDETGPRIVAPEDGASVALSSWDGVYRWEPPPKAGASARPPDAWRVLGERLAALLSPISVAHAHGAPVTDDVYLLELFVPGAECPTRVVTTATSWPLDDDARGALQPGTTLQAQITWAYEEDSIVLEGTDSGPLRPASLHSVTLEP